VIDIHSHILYGIDDGPKSFEDSVEMVQMAAAAGTTDIVATPHANQKYAFDPRVVQERISELQAAVGRTPQIYYGCDFHLTMENIDDAVRAPEKYSINHKGYLLIEFSDFYIPKTTPEILARLMGAHLRPIITHPERNQLLQTRVQDLAEWVAQGAMLQVTAQSFTGRFGRTAKRISEVLMANGLVQFVASDAHDKSWRPPTLDEPCRLVRRNFGEAAARRVFEENPRAVLAGVPLSPEPVLIKRRKWYTPW